MLWTASTIHGYAIEATDGTIGSVDDFLFSDDSWIIRWAVVDTGNWLCGLPESVGGAHPEAGGGQPRDRSRSAGLAPAGDADLLAFRLGALLGFNGSERRPRRAGEDP